MPRSGSTLLEQILSSHGKVAGLGEAPAIWRTIAGRFPNVAEPAAEDDPEYFRKLAEDYLARQRAAGWSKAPFLVDKMLGNYINIGMIHLMFPNATILHSVRDPVDTCLGCFRQLFRSGNETTYDLRDIGAQYVRYREMMAHWDTVLPGRVVDVVHEDLVSDPDAQDPLADRGCLQTEMGRQLPAIPPDQARRTHRERCPGPPADLQQRVAALAKICRSSRTPAGSARSLCAAVTVGKPE